MDRARGPHGADSAAVQGRVACLGQRDDALRRRDPRQEGRLACDVERLALGSAHRPVRTRGHRCDLLPRRALPRARRLFAAARWTRSGSRRRASATCAGVRRRRSPRSPSSRNRFAACGSPNPRRPRPDGGPGGHRPARPARRRTPPGGLRGRDVRGGGVRRPAGLARLARVSAVLRLSRPASSARSSTPPGRSCKRPTSEPPHAGRRRLARGRHRAAPTRQSRQ